MFGRLMLSAPFFFFFLKINPPSFTVILLFVCYNKLTSMSALYRIDLSCVQPLFFFLKVQQVQWTSPNVWVCDANRSVGPLRCFSCVGVATVRSYWLTRQLLIVFLTPSLTGPACTLTQRISCACSAFGAVQLRREANKREGKKQI